jgi:hypothetical protein
MMGVCSIGLRRRGRERGGRVWVWGREEWSALEAGEKSGESEGHRSDKAGDCLSVSALSIHLLKFLLRSSRLLRFGDDRSKATTSSLLSNQSSRYG